MYFELKEKPQLKKRNYYIIISFLINNYVSVTINGYIYNYI